MLRVMNKRQVCLKREGSLRPFCGLLLCAFPYIGLRAEWIKLQTAPSSCLSVSLDRFFSSNLGSFLYPTQSAGPGHHCVLREMQNAFLVQPRNVAPRNKTKSLKTTVNFTVICNCYIRHTDKTELK